MSEPLIVGMQPWLPWPLRQWRSWTEPVPAERLAALRIGLAVILFLDILITYWPDQQLFFGPESLSRSPGLDPFAYYTRSPRWSWSLLRGLGDANNFALILALWAAATTWVLARISGSSRATADLWSPVMAWTASTVLAVFAVWTRLEAGDFAPTSAALGAAILAWCLACGLAIWHRIRAGRWLSLALVPWAVMSFVLGLGVFRHAQKTGILADTWQFRDFLADWDQQPDMLRLAMLAWLALTLCLAIGFWTRGAAVAVWVLTNSFDNLNPQINNNGDVARNILLFYLMISPCGAAWSVDRCLKRGPGPVLIYPWVLRLCLLQLVLIYFLNGLYKLLGEQWREGDSLYYVLANPVMTRVSYAQFPMPPLLLQVISYTVLAWELSFPILVAVRWTRVPALLLGALFHLGIWAHLDLGFFSAYMLSYYLPLIPWENLRFGTRPTT